MTSVTTTSTLSATTWLTAMDSATQATLVLVASICAVFVYIWSSLAFAGLFTKLGEDAWKGWVPLLNIGILLRWGGFSPWLAALTIVPGAGLAIWVLCVVVAHRINPGLGYGSTMTVLAAVLPLIWLSVVGFGPARWLGAHRPGAARGSVVAEADSAPEPAETEPVRAESIHPISSGPALSTRPTPIVTASPSDDTVWAPPESPTPAEDRSPAARRSESTRRRPLIDSVPAFGAVASERSADEVYPELADEVSAVFDSPVAGEPRSARASIPAQQGMDNVMSGEDLDRTFVVPRVPKWYLHPEFGARIALEGDVFLIGRSPIADPAYPDAQLIAVDDPSRTVSKTHVRVELRGRTWAITDLFSTNGVTVITVDEEEELEAGGTGVTTDRFRLGDAEFRLVPSQRS